MWNARPGGDLCPAAIYSIEHIQPILDVCDRGVVRQLFDELQKELLR